MDMYDTSHRDQVLMMINYDSTTIEKQNMLPQCTVPHNGHGQNLYLLSLVFIMDWRIVAMEVLYVLRD